MATIAREPLHGKSRCLKLTNSILSPGIIADVFGMGWAINTIAALTFLSGTIMQSLTTHERD
jgi:hypothetical protein